MPKQNATVRAADYRALADFRYELRRFLKWSEDAARAVGLEPQQHQLMLAIKGLPPGVDASVGYLSERLMVKHHSTVELIDRLDARGLVRRDRSTEDRRRISVRLTPKGERLIAKLSRHHAEMLRTTSALMAALRALNSPP